MKVKVKSKDVAKVILKLNMEEAEILMGILDHSAITECHPKLQNIFDKFFNADIKVNYDIFRILDKKLK